jgi:hypothetical protein
MRTFKSILATILIFTQVNAYAGKIQTQDIKTSAECVTAGATAATCLPKTSQIYDPTNATDLASSFAASIVGILLGRTKVDQTLDITGTTPVANGGTGLATLTAHNLYAGNGTAAPTPIPPGNNTNVLTSNGTDWISAPASGGNGKSYLANTGFESTPASTSWTVTNSTATTETTTFVEGFQSIKLALSSQTGDLLVQSVTPNINTTSQNFEATCRVNTTLSTIQLCALSGGSEVACQTVSSSGTFGLVTQNFPAPATGTSVGVKIKATSSSTGNVFVDDCYVGQARNIGTVQQAILLGTVKITGCASNWSTTSTSYTDYGTQSGCTYATTGSALAPSTNLPAIKFASIPAGQLRLEYEGQFGNTGGQVSFAQFSDGTNTALEESQAGQGSGATSASISQTINYTNTQSNVTLTIKGKVNTASTNALYGSTSFPGVIKVWLFPSQTQQVVAPQQANYDWTPYTPTFTGFGTPTSVECQDKREGSDDLIRCKFISGVTTGVEGRVSLRSGLTSADTTKIPSIQLAGKGNMNTDSSTFFSGLTALIEPSVTYFTIGLESNTTNGITKANGNSIAGSGNTLSFTLRVPIQGWIQTNSAPLLINSITSNNNYATRTENALVSTQCTSSPCTIASGNADGWLTNITRSAAGTYTLNIVSGVFSATPVCFFIGVQFSGYPGFIISGTPSATSYPIVTGNMASGFTATDNGFAVTCSGPR